jgi:hypothetical protein
MKRLLIGITLLTSMSSFANDSLKGSYELQSGDDSCERSVSIIDTKKTTEGQSYSGLRFVETRKVGGMFEHENAEDFLNINKSEVITKTKNSSHGIKYVSKAKSKQIANTLTKEESLKEYLFF